MFKKFLISIIVVFLAIYIMNIILHGMILRGLYNESANIWRPEADMKVWVLCIATFLSTIGFVYIYYKLINNKSPFRGFWYGAAYGFATGVAAGYSTYAMLPMPYGLAVGWFIGGIIEYGIAGWIMGAIMKEPAAETAAN